MKEPTFKDLQEAREMLEASRCCGPLEVREYEKVVERMEAWLYPPEALAVGDEVEVSPPNAETMDTFKGKIEAILKRSPGDFGHCYRVRLSKSVSVPAWDRLNEDRYGAHWFIVSPL